MNDYSKMRYMMVYSCLQYFYFRVMHIGLELGNG
jgi:hypothetical protein